MDDEEDERENQMWKISIDIQDGENEYVDEIFYLGQIEDAIRYAESYMNDYFGEDTEWDDRDGCWYSENEERAAAYDIWPFEHLVAMTEKGTLTYRVDFHLD
jgi:hypothetical protein